MKKTRLLPLLLAIMLAFSFTAVTASATDSGDIMSPYGKYPELITLSTAKRSSATPNFAEGDSVGDNAMTRYIKDKLNVEIKIEWEVEPTEFANKLALNLASGDLPDMFTLNPTADYLLYRQLLENDMLADLTEAYDKCAGTYMKDVFNSFENKNLAPFTEDGKLYGIAGGRYGYEHNILWLRQDWMDECGLEAPKTLDDLKNILTVFKEKNPGGQNVGMLLHPTQPADVYSGYSPNPIYAAFGAYPRAWITGKDGTPVWGTVQPEMKEALALLSDWYKEGLIDQQFPTRTANGATDAVWNGSQSGACFTPWWFAYTQGDLPRNNPDARPVPYNAPLDNDGKFNIMWPGPAGDVLLVNKDYEYPEAVVKVMNCEFDMWRQFDPEGAELIAPNRAANVDWGYMFPTSGVNLEYADIIPNVGLLAKNMVEKGVLEGADSATDMDRQMATEAKAYADTGSLEGMGWIHYHGRYLGSNLMKTPEVNIVYPAFSFTTESMADLKPNLDKLENEAILQIIIGEQPIDYFDTFVEQWHAQGGDIITQEVEGLVAQ